MGCYKYRGFCRTVSTGRKSTRDAAEGDCRPLNAFVRES